MSEENETSEENNKVQPVGNESHQKGEAKEKQDLSFGDYLEEEYERYLETFKKNNGLVPTEEKEYYKDLYVKKYEGSPKILTLFALLIALIVPLLTSLPVLFTQDLFTFSIKLVCGVITVFVLAFFLWFWVKLTDNTHAARRAEAADEFIDKMNEIQKEYACKK